LFTSAEELNSVEEKNNVVFQEMLDYSPSNYGKFRYFSSTELE
jgi:hypothetical protein